LLELPLGLDMTGLGIDQLLARFDLLGFRIISLLCQRSEIARAPLEQRHLLPERFHLRGEVGDLAARLLDLLLGGGALGRDLRLMGAV